MPLHQMQEERTRNEGMRGMRGMKKKELQMWKE
jgi:hypothetical protein